ncbi:hypothetical protein IP88_00030 [alpha proteobacterium AAP81b]|nr:hypothetical protein IP88_00030 [alpha proteobacterium AAP81b]
MIEVLQYIVLLALLASNVIAWRWGGLDEKLAASGFAVAGLASNLANQSFYVHTETGVLAVDIMLLAGLIALALRSDRFWPMYAAAFQLVAVTVHVASMTEHGNFAWAYAVGLIFWTYPVLIALMAGTWFEGRFRPR